MFYCSDRLSRLPHQVLTTKRESTIYYWSTALATWIKPSNIPLRRLLILSHESSSQHKLSALHADARCISQPCQRSSSQHRSCPSVSQHQPIPPLYTAVSAHSANNKSAPPSAIMKQTESESIPPNLIPNPSRAYTSYKKTPLASTSRSRTAT